MAFRPTPPSPGLRKSPAAGGSRYQYYKSNTIEQDRFVYKQLIDPVNTTIINTIYTIINTNTYN